jgi:glycosyltransferase involved in cell wall biosynthesis
VLPALDEEDAVGGVVRGLRLRGVPLVIVADNGSRDGTAHAAAAAGAVVVPAPVRGYGAACAAALAIVPSGARAVLFCDADGADDLRHVSSVVAPVLGGDADLVVGSRVLGQAEPGALTPPQRAGNLVAAAMLRVLFRRRVTDLGPFRCVSTAALRRLRMRDPAFGWTAEMQTKALRLGMRVLEVAVDARVRRAGTSKISGRAIPVLLAGWAITTTILRYRFGRIGTTGDGDPAPAGSALAPAVLGAGCSLEDE